MQTAYYLLPTAYSVSRIRGGIIIIHAFQSLCHFRGIKHLNLVFFVGNGEVIERVFMK